MWCYCVLVLCVLVPVCVCESVLVVFPVARRSHTLLGDHVVKTLLHEGHNVTYITTFSRVKASERLRVIDVSSANGDVTDATIIPRLLEMTSSRIPSAQFLADATRSVEGMLRHADVQALMKDAGEHFDLVVAEWYYSRLLAPLAAVFECPLVWYSAVDVSWMSLQLVHEASSPAHSVDLRAAALPALPPSMPDRAYRIARQAYLFAWVHYTTFYVEEPLYYEIYQLAIQLRGRTPPLYEDLVCNGSFLLVNSHPLLGQGLPLPNNAKYVGGHHLQGSAATLPKDLQAILDNAKNGVIYMNLGSTLSKELPPELTLQLLRVFRQVEQTIVWKYRGKLEHVPENVKIVERAPNTILKHPNTIIMISHGGFLSYLEAMYHGVPVIGIPVEEDQLLTMDVAVARGTGVRVPFSGKVGYRIKDAIFEILGNSSYRNNTKATSAILQRPLVPAHQEMLYWINLVMRTAGAPHLRSPAVQLGIVERFHLDVAIVLVMIAWFLSKVAKLVKVYWNDLGTDCDDVKKND